MLRAAFVMFALTVAMLHTRCAGSRGSGSGGVERGPVPVDRPVPAVQGHDVRVGEAPVISLAVAPTHDAIAWVTADSVRLGDAAGGGIRWETPVPASRGIACFSRDGSRIAWTSAGTSGWMFRVLDARTGRVLDARELQPPRSSPHSMRPSWPTRISVSADGAGWWITNADGVHAVAPTGVTLTAVPNESEGTQVAPDGTLWRHVAGGIAGGASPTVVRASTQDCYVTGDFTVDPALDRIAFECAPSPTSPIELRLASISQGTVLARFAVGQLNAPAFLSANRLVAFAPERPAAVWLEQGQPPRWQASSGPSLASEWERIEIAPSGRFAVGTTSNGGFEAIALPSGQHLCGATDVGISARGAGFASDDTLWIVGVGPHADTPLPDQATIASVRLPDCNPRARSTAAAGPTQHPASWLPRARAFVVEGIDRQGNGILTYVPVEHPERAQLLSSADTHGHVVNGEGDRIARGGGSTDVWFAGETLRAATGTIGEETWPVAFCGSTLIARREGRAFLTLYDTDTMAPIAAIATGAQVSACAGNRAVLGDNSRLVVVDLAARRIEMDIALSHDTRVSSLQVTPDGRSVLYATQHLGWRMVALPVSPPAASPRP